MFHRDLLDGIFLLPIEIISRTQPHLHFYQHSLAGNRYFVTWRYHYHRAVHYTNWWAHYVRFVASELYTCNHKLSIKFESPRNISIYFINYLSINDWILESAVSNSKRLSTFSRKYFLHSSLYLKRGAVNMSITLMISSEVFASNLQHSCAINQLRT